MENLTEFTAYLRGKAEDFESEWLDERSRNPDDWPIEMSRADWIEQFIIELDR